MKAPVLFVLDLAAIVCALRAISLLFSVRRMYADGNQLAWKMSEASGFMAVGCVCALAALLAAIFVP